MIIYIYSAKIHFVFCSTSKIKSTNPDHVSFSVKIRYQDFEIGNFLTFFLHHHESLQLLNFGICGQ